MNNLISDKQFVILKARQIGKSSITDSLMAWRTLYGKHERVRLRKETIKRLFNI